MRLTSSNISLFSTLYIAALLTSCGASNEPTVSDPSASLVNAASPFGATALGLGDSTARQKLMSRCLREPDAVRIVLNASSFEKLDVPASLSDIAAMLHLDRKSREGFRSIGIEPLGDFLYRPQSDRFSDSQLHAHIIQTRVLQPETPFDQQALLHGPQDFTKDCGDEFVSTTREGAAFFVNVTHSFRNESVKNEFVAKKGISGLRLDPERRSTLRS